MRVIKKDFSTLPDWKPSEQTTQAIENDPSTLEYHEKFCSYMGHQIGTAISSYRVFDTSYLHWQENAASVSPNDIHQEYENAVATWNEIAQASPTLIRKLKEEYQNNYSREERGTLNNQLKVACSAFENSQKTLSMLKEQGLALANPKNWPADTAIPIFNHEFPFLGNNLG